jgi:hypothetical protein
VRVGVGVDVRQPRGALLNKTGTRVLCKENTNAPRWMQRVHLDIVHRDFLQLVVKRRSEFRVIIAPLDLENFPLQVQIPGVGC